MRHGPHVELQEGEERPAVGVDDLYQRVRGDGALPVGRRDGERLARVRLALEAGEPRALGRARLQRHPDLGEPGRVGEEERVGLAALASARRRAAADGRLALPRRPEVVRRRAAFTVGAGSADEPFTGEPRAAVPEGAPRRRARAAAHHLAPFGGCSVGDVPVGAPPFAIENCRWGAGAQIARGADGRISYLGAESPASRFAVQGRGERQGQDRRETAWGGRSSMRRGCLQTRLGRCARSGYVGAGRHSSFPPDSAPMPRSGPPKACDEDGRAGVL